MKYKLSPSGVIEQTKSLKEKFKEQQDKLRAEQYGKIAMVALQRGTRKRRMKEKK